MSVVTEPGFTGGHCELRAVWGKQPDETCDEAGVQLSTPQKATLQNGIVKPNAPWAAPVCYWIQQEHAPASSAGRKSLILDISNPTVTQPAKKPPTQTCLRRKKIHKRCKTLDSNKLDA